MTYFLVMFSEYGDARDPPPPKMIFSSDFWHKHLDEKESQ